MRGKMAACLARSVAWGRWRGGRGGRRGWCAPTDSSPAPRPAKRYIFSSVLRIRVRDPVPLWLLDPGSGVFLTWIREEKIRIRDPGETFRIRSIDTDPSICDLESIRTRNNLIASWIIFLDPAPKPNPKLKWSNFSLKTKLFSKKKA